MSKLKMIGFLIGQRLSEVAEKLWAGCKQLLGMGRVRGEVHIALPQGADEKTLVEVRRRIEEAQAEGKSIHVSVHTGADALRLFKAEKNYVPMEDRKKEEAKEEAQSTGRCGMCGGALRGKMYEEQRNGRKWRGPGGGRGQGQALIERGQGQGQGQALPRQTD